MKKIFFVLCTFAALALTACHRENNNPDNHGGNNNNNGPDIPQGEGIYNPTGAHIATIDFSDNGDNVDQKWVWSDYKLQRIEEKNAAGDYDPAYTYTYDNWRLSQMIMLSDEMPGTVNYTYTSNKLTGISITSSGMNIADAEIVRNSSDKIVHMDIIVNNEIIQMLVGLLSDGFGDMDKKGKDMLTPVFGHDLTRAMAVAAEKLYHGQKLSVNSTDFEVDFTWSGNNVASAVVTATINGGITFEELNQFVNLETIVGTDYYAVLAAIAGTDELPIELTVADTMEYTYDQKKNPFQGFYGQLDISTFSANNVASSFAHGWMDASITFSVPLLGDQVIPFGMPLEGDSEPTTFTYTYNNAGFPVSRESSHYVTATYKYSD